ncbi:MAG: type II toxin-antitoxin system HipA family toxin [Terracidiphilus sp.]
MTSRPTSECFVYIALPHAVAPVAAGRFVLESGAGGGALGRFVYGRSYLQNPHAVDIDPIELKLSQATYQTSRLNGVFGALRDAGPDYWGRRIIEKRAGKTILGELDYLLESPGDRAGALGFGLSRVPPAPLRKFNRTLDLEKLQQIAEALVRDEIPATPRAAPPGAAQIDAAPIDAPQIQDLLLLGTSMGGARPKAVIEDAGALWVAKFARRDDRWNYARVEHAMLRLARQCGIDAAESRVESIAGKDAILIRRFDRDKTPRGYTRSRMISALTALRADEAADTRDRWSYVLLAEELRRFVSKPKEDARELFRRMCFNALISNLDDHPRNHAFLAVDQDWRLSPAYDLTPSPVVGQDRRDLAMECGDQGRLANAANLLSQHARFLLEREEAQAIVDRMRVQVEKTWRRAVRACGVSTHDAETIRSAFVYPGFSRA